MSENLRKGLLPAGLQDILPPQASHESAVVQGLLGCFMAQGYEQVKPPLLEFEDSLFQGAGEAVAAQTFRLMDPVSQQMMGLRADMTPQVARIAATRLSKTARPLRLCYAGQALQVRGSQLRPERQFGQVGVELIGPAQLSADAEVVLLAAEALKSVGVEGLSIDLNVPPLVADLARHLGFSKTITERLGQALDGKDAAAVNDIAGAKSSVFLELLRSAGPADSALRSLQDLDLPESGTAAVTALRDMVALVHQNAPDLTLTIDPVEHRGFEYHTGISFIVFASGTRGELGRGGRYRSSGFGEDESGEDSTGFSLFMDTVMRAVPAPEGLKRIYLPPGFAAAAARDLRKTGWITIAGFDPQADDLEEAKRLRCSHFVSGGKPKKIKDG